MSKNTVLNSLLGCLLNLYLTVLQTQQACSNRFTPENKYLGKVRRIRL